MFFRSSSTSSFSSPKPSIQSIEFPGPAMKPSRDIVTCQRSRAMGYDPPAMRRRLYRPMLIASTIVTFLMASALYLSNPTALVSNAVARGTVAPLDNQNHLYVLDGWGGIHPVGASHALSTT